MKNFILKHKVVILSIIFMLIVQSVFGQDSAITSKLESFKTGLKNILHVAVAVLAIGTIFSIVQRYFTNDENGGKHLTKWVSGLIIFAVADFIIIWVLG